MKNIVTTLLLALAAFTISKADGMRIDSIFKEGAEKEMQPLLWKLVIPLDEVKPFLTNQTARLR